MTGKISTSTDTSLDAQQTAASKLAERYLVRALSAVRDGLDAIPSVNAALACLHYAEQLAAPRKQDRLKAARELDELQELDQDLRELEPV